MKKVENLIYEVRRKQVMLDSDVSATKCNDSIITHYDIGNQYQAIIIILQTHLQNYLDRRNI